jgi:uncharacterized protein (TIGR03435 family)
MSCRNVRTSYLGHNLACILMRALLFIPIAIATPSGAQTAPPPTFEVATVKPIDAKDPRPPSVLVSGDRFSLTGMTLQELIKIAYDMNYGADRQISGGVAWVGSARFDIEAKEDAALSERLHKLSSQQRGEQLREMLRGLLAERFKLQIHHESSELPVYQLVLAKSGSKLMPSAAQLSAKPEDHPERPRNFVRFAGKGVLEGNDADSQTLVTALSMQPEIGGRLVIDKTGLTGKYDFTLKWTPDTQSVDATAIDTGPSLFTALQEQLGVRLESTKAPVDIIVIDHVELPSAN